MRALALLLLLAAEPEEGFGGGRVDEAGESVSDSESECQVKDARGVWRSCAELLEEPTPPHEERAPRPAPETAVPSAAEPELNKVREISTTKPPSGAFARAIDDAQREVTESFPLVALRERVDAIGAEVDALEQDPLRSREAPAKKREHRHWQAVLAHVEEVAFRLVRSCISTEKPEWAEAYTPPSLYRMTPGGPVPLAPDETRQLPSFDPPGCERIRLVDDATIGKVARLHEIQRALDEEKLGFHERDRKKALLAEADALKRELGEGGVAGVPKLDAEQLKVKP